MSGLCVILSEAERTGACPEYSRRAKRCSFFVSSRPKSLSLCHPDRSERTLATRNDLGQLRESEAGTGSNSLFRHPDRSERTLATRNDLGQLRAAKPLPVPSLCIQFLCHPEHSEGSRAKRVIASPCQGEADASSSMRRVRVQIPNSALLRLFASSDRKESPP
jgi:hypothetical protein